MGSLVRGNLVVSSGIWFSIVIWLLIPISYDKGEVKLIKAGYGLKDLGSWLAAAGSEMPHITGYSWCSLVIVWCDDCSNTWWLVWQDCVDVIAEKLPIATEEDFGSSKLIMLIGDMRSKTDHQKED